MASAHQGKLETIEAARGLAALAVVFFHANAAAAFIGVRTFEWLSIGEHGVDFFFVLSGFIIFFVHYNDIGRPEAARDYLLKRGIRLYPILWMVVAALAVVRTALDQPLSLSTLGTSLLLYPSTVEPAPQVVWTLRHEALFYLAFLSAILSRRAGLLLFGVWTTAALFQLILSLMGSPIGGMASFFLSSYELDFLFGAGIAILHRRRAFRRSSLPFILALILICALFWIEEHFEIKRTGLLDYSTPAATLWVAVLGLGFAAVLHGLLCIEGKFKVPRFLLLLGGASYAIYLIHTPVNSIAQRLVRFIAEPLEFMGGAQLFIVACGVVAGIMLHLWVERPLSKRLRTRLLSRRTDLFRHSAVGAVRTREATHEQRP
jgi:peptidoglycan/LPS O-acetylase OafA/YrhL